MSATNKEDHKECGEQKQMLLRRHSKPLSGLLPAGFNQKEV
jgi:hypothetical protein